MSLRNRIENVARNYNEGNVSWLTEKVLDSIRVSRSIMLGQDVSDDVIDEEVSYYEYDYAGDSAEGIDNY